MRFYNVAVKTLHFLKYISTYIEEKEAILENRV